jgi:tRNA threonylcarbamoyladenosine biosynthesis protein TsaB
VALSSATEVLQLSEFRGTPRASATLFPVLERFKLPERELSRIIVGLGPGSFASIRVAIAAMQGIALAKRTLIVGICSAWSIARQFRDAPRLAVYTDARRGEVCCCSFHRGKQERPPYLIPRAQLPEEMKHYTHNTTSDDLPEVSQRVNPRAVDFLSFPIEMDVWVPETRLEPIYLREPM